MSEVARTWERSLRGLGLEVVTVAGAGTVDRVVPGLEWPTSGAVPDRDQLAGALADADLVVVENVCSLPLHPGATEAVVATLRGRPAVLHHHDLPWQRTRFADVEGWPPDDPAWRHVAISDWSRRQLAERGVKATTIRNGFDVEAPAGDRERGRALAAVAPDERLVLHPVRAIERKAVPVALRLAAALGATYWLTGPAEEGYGPTLAALLSTSPCPVVHRAVPGRVADAYAAADAIVLSSTEEGFGNPLVESAVHRRPLAVSPYPVAEEVAELGFRWFPVSDHRPLDRFLRRPDPSLHDHNAALARRHFSLARVTGDVAALLGEMGLR